MPSIELGQPAGAGDDERRPAGERLEGDDPERLVERRDDDASGAVDGVAQLVVGEEAGEVDEVADALEVDLRLQLREVAAAPADDALDPRHPGPQQAHRPGEHLEALLVLDPAPREHERRPPARRLARRPPRRVDAVGDQVGALGGELEAVDRPRARGTWSWRAPRRRRGRATTRRRGSCSARRAAPGRRAGRARWCGTWRRAWPSWSAASVSAAQATCQSWAWTTSGRQAPSRAVSCTRWWLAEATRATSSSSGSHGRSVRARSTRTAPTVLSAGAPGWPA